MALGCVLYVSSPDTMYVPADEMTTPSADTWAPVPCTLAESPDSVMTVADDAS